jgi:hypothetical protein
MVIPLFGQSDDGCNDQGPGLAPAIAPTQSGNVLFSQLNPIMVEWFWHAENCAKTVPKS